MDSELILLKSIENDNEDAIWAYVRVHSVEYEKKEESSIQLGLF